ncbi:MAG: hypothetical protein WKF89_10615 [Chitinophagaceae bacterium]
MNEQFFIKFKAAFLLLVFALNTVVGFACQMGADLIINSTPHPGKVRNKEVVHIHKHGKLHKHKETSRNDVQAHHHMPRNQTAPKNNTENCCNNAVMNFDQPDKSTVLSFTLSSPVYFTTLITSFLVQDITFFNVPSPSRRFAQSHHPPIPDIRVAIRSFQI